MNRTEATDLLLSTFITAWGSTTAVSLDNQFFEPPIASWVRITIENSFSMQNTLGPELHRKFNRRGFISYQIFVLPDSALYIGGTLCEDINNVFEGKRFSDILCYSGNWSPTGITPDGAYYQYNGVIDFEFDQTK